MEGPWTLYLAPCANGWSVLGLNRLITPASTGCPPQYSATMSLFSPYPGTDPFRSIVLSRTDTLHDQAASECGSGPGWERAGDRQSEGGHLLFLFHALQFSRGFLEVVQGPVKLAALLSKEMLRLGTDEGEEGLERARSLAIQHPNVSPCASQPQTPLTGHLRDSIPELAA